jgi:arylsulfatase
MPLAGTSIAYTFSGENVMNPRTKQYFEMGGHRAMYREGWKAVTRHVPGVSFDDDRWELYHVAVDHSECHDLASSNPELLAELIDLWWSDADEYSVLPLDDRGFELFGARFRENSPHPPSRHYTYYPPLNPIPPQAAAGIGGRSWDLDAVIDRPTGAEGVVMAFGTENAGVSLFVQDDRLVFDYNFFNDHHIVESGEPVPTGPSVIGLRFRRGKNDADVALTIDGREAGSYHLPVLMRMMSTIGMSIGRDQGSPVSRRYEGEFAFEGKLERVDIQLVSQDGTEEKVTAAREGMARQ